MCFSNVRLYVLRFLLYSVIRVVSKGSHATTTNVIPAAWHVWGRAIDNVRLRHCSRRLRRSPVETLKPQSTRPETNVRVEEGNVYHPTHQANRCLLTRRPRAAARDRHGKRCDGTGWGACPHSCSIRLGTQTAPYPGRRGWPPGRQVCQGHHALGNIWIVPRARRWIITAQLTCFPLSRQATHTIDLASAMLIDRIGGSLRADRGGCIPGELGGIIPVVVRQRRGLTDLYFPAGAVPVLQISIWHIPSDDICIIAF